MIRSLIAFALLAGGTVQAAEPAKVVASDGWVRVLPGNLPASGYLTLRNDSDRAVSIVSASSPGYADAMIHRSSTDGGMGRMEMVDSVPLPPNGKVVFAPGGYHVMLMQAKHPVKPGDAVSVTFTMSDGATVSATLVARPANASGP